MASEPLPNGWRLAKLGNLGEVNRGRSRHRPRYAEHLYGGPYPFIQTGDIKNSGGRLTTYQQTYSEAGLAQSRLWPKGTMCITIAANIAETAILGFPACFPDSVVGFIADESKCDLHFIEYAFRHLKLHLQHEASGSVQDNINLATLEQLRFPLPPLAEQRTIANILGTLDDKIELNRRMNETLEAMARALFKSWFIDFDPVRRNMARKMGQNQPSPPAPLPKGEGGKTNYRGGYDFSGLLETARALRRKQTSAEDLFWELVRDRRFLGRKFRRQHQLGDYIADYYCHEHRLVIELDGGIHSTTRKKDHKRDAWMESKGYKVLRFTNNQVLDDPESVLTTLANASSHPLPLGEGRGEDVDEASAPPLPLGEGWGEGVGEGSAFDHLFPDSFESSELGEIPKGWNVRSLYETAAFINGAAFKSADFCEPGFGLPIVKIAELKDGITAQTKFSGRFLDQKQMIDTGELLYSWSGSPDTSLDVFLWTRGPGLLNQHIFKIVTPTIAEKRFVYYLLNFLRPTLVEIARNKQTTGLGHVTVADMKRLNVSSSPLRVLEVFDNLIAPLFDKTFQNTIEKQTLVNLRDTLLPKLISGELRVPGTPTPMETIICQHPTT
ncbi:DUF559 domain-containing protein [Candidatus Nitrospira salsa]